MLVAGILLNPPCARAQSAVAPAPPDAGALRQQMEQGRDNALKRRIPPPEAADAPGADNPASGVQVEVKSFRIVGNTLLDPAELDAELVLFTDSTMDFNQLQVAVTAVIERYKRAGWVVRAFLPKQEVVDGVVTIVVVEAIFAGTRTQVVTAPRVDLAQAEKIIANQQAVGQPLNAYALDRALLLLDDLPGVSANGYLEPGSQRGESLLALSLDRTPLLSGDATLDNFGNRSTGPLRLGLNVDLNSPFQLGDLLRANLLWSEGSSYLRLGASVPVGSDGWRLGANASSMRYRVLLDAFAALDASGSSDSLGLEASYPLLRSRLHNLYLGASLDSRRYDNQSNGAASSHYRSDSLGLGLSGNAFDGFAGGGASSFNVVWSNGVLDLAGSASQSADAATTRTEGSYNKVRYTLTRQQTLRRDLQLVATLSGQWADRNLDSSEKFYLGGAFGVRAYPGNEAGGTRVQLLNLELRQSLYQGLYARAFMDIGRVKTNVYNNFTGAPANNDSDLRGYGLGLGWQHGSGLNLQLVWARRIDSNPRATSAGTDEDGSLLLDRWWFTASRPF